MAAILILDDDLHVSESLAMGLEDEGLEVFQVDSAEGALAFLEGQQVDLVIVDLRLPGMNGTDFIDAARARWKDLVFIIYTGSPEYRIPTSLASVASVSNSVFLKPLPDYVSIIAEIHRMLRSGTSENE